MRKRLEAAEAEARRAVDDWTAAGHACAAYPGVGAMQMFDADRKLIARIAAAYEVATPDAAALCSAWGLAWARSAIDAAFGLSVWMTPWASADVRTLMQQGMTERFGEVALTSFRARSRLS